MKIFQSTVLTLSGGWSTDFAVRDSAEYPTTVRPAAVDSTTQIAIGYAGGPVGTETIDVTIEGFVFKGAKLAAVHLTANEQDSVTTRVIDTIFRSNRITQHGDEGALFGACDRDAAMNIIVSDSRFVKNKGLGGAAIALWGLCDTTLSVTNSVISDNTIISNYGGAAVRVYSIGTATQDVVLDFTNTTITRNTARRGEYGGFWFGGYGVGTKTLNLKNTIVWGNRASEPDEGADIGVGDAQPPLFVNADHSDLGDVHLDFGTFTDLGGNVDVDPGFVSPKDLRLAAGSPFVDAGTDTGASATDIDGDPRPVDGDGDTQATTDIGADEYVP